MIWNILEQFASFLMVYLPEHYHCRPMTLVQTEPLKRFLLAVIFRLKIKIKIKHI